MALGKGYGVQTPRNMIKTSKDVIHAIVLAEYPFNWWVS
jgi:hypothetical protein